MYLRLDTSMNLVSTSQEIQESSYMSKNIENKKLVILVGQPNSGKTTLFNVLTNSHFQTGNYPGITVDYSVGKLDTNLSAFNWNIVDSPGIRSLQPKSEDERVTINCLIKHPKLGIPDAIIAVVDANQLSRHLFLVKQLQNAGFPVIVAITMNDLLEKNHGAVDIKKLSLLLNLPCFPVNAKTGSGIKELVEGTQHFFSFNQTQQNITILPTYAPDQIISIFQNLSELEKKVLKFTKVSITKENPQLFQNHTSNKVDTFFLHPIYGSISFFLIMGTLFTSIFWLSIPLMDLVDSLFGYLSLFCLKIIPDSILRDFLVDGVIAGLGSVFVFVPQIAILFFLTGILEDSGYLSRASMLIDMPLKKLGLSGRSFVPMLSGFACAIPGILAARNIPNKKERFLTIFIMPLMSCSARLPVYSLLLTFLAKLYGAWIGGLGLLLLYVFSVVNSSVMAAIASRFMKNSERSIFTLELPSYKLPVLRLNLRASYHRTKSYITNAGATILVISLILWTLTYFPRPENSSANTHQRIEHSYAAQISKAIEPIVEPMGVDWRIGVAMIASFAAREVFVSSMALIFHITEADEAGIQDSLLNQMSFATLPSGKKLFTPSSIIGLLVFYSLALQCVSTLAVSRKETQTWFLPMIQLFTFTGLAYLASVISVQTLRFFGLS